VRLSCGQEGVVQLGQPLIAKRVLCARAARCHSRGLTVGHWMLRIVPSGSRSIVGA